MGNPLLAFERQMVKFEIVRNGTTTSTSRGLRNVEKSSGRKMVQFLPDVDVQVGDVLINSNIKYYVTEIDVDTWYGETSAIVAYYQTTPPTLKNADSITYNITNPSNSIIGNQQSAIINNSSFDFENLKELIELYGNNDKEQLYELTSLLQDILKKDDFHKSKLSKFGDLIAKHAWLPTAIAQIIAGYLSH